MFETRSPLMGISANRRHPQFPPFEKGGLGGFQISRGGKPWRAGVGHNVVGDRAPTLRPETDGTKRNKNGMPEKLALIQQYCPPRGERGVRQANPQAIEKLRILSLTKRRGCTKRDNRFFVLFGLFRWLFFMVFFINEVPSEPLP